MSNTNFHIEIIEEGKILVVPTSYLRPEFYMEQLEGMLANEFKSVTCVYFDFLIKNGTSDRFYKASFSNRKLTLNSLTSVVAEPFLVNKSNSFFAKNLDLITNSFLTRSQKFLLRRTLASSFI